MIRNNQPMIDDFEQARQQQETHNEIIISWIITIAFASVSAILAINQYIVRFMPVLVSPVLTIIGLTIYSGVLVYLHRTTHYTAARKYGLTILQTLVVTIGLIVSAASATPTGIYLYLII